MGIPGRSFISLGSWIGIPGKSFVSFSYWIRIPAGSSVSFGSRIGILDGFLVFFGSWIGIPAGFFISFGSWMRILGGFFVYFGSRIGILTGFLLLRARSKSDLYKDRLIFYRDSAAPHGFGYVIASRKDSFFLSLMKEKKQKKIKAMIAIYFCLVHVVNGRYFVHLGNGKSILAGFLLLRARPKSNLYKDRLIFYRGNATLYEFGYVIASRNGSSFLSLMKEKKQKKIKAMIAIYFCLVHVVNGQYFVHLGDGKSILASFLLLRGCSKSDPYKDGLIFYRDSAALHGFGYVITPRKDSSFLSLMKEKNQKKIKAMIAIYFCLVHVVNGRCLVRLGEGSAIFAGELLLCSLYMRKKCLHFFRLCLVFVSKTCSNFGAMKRRESLPI